MKDWEYYLWILLSRHLGSPWEERAKNRKQHGKIQRDVPIHSLPGRPSRIQKKEKSVRSVKVRKGFKIDIEFVCGEGVQKNILKTQKA